MRAFLDLTGTSYFIAAVVVYYSMLFALARFRPRLHGGSNAAPLVVLLVPARNEELVIAETLANLAVLEYSDHLVLVINDNSTDKTASIIVRVAERSLGRVILVDRTGIEAGGGKSGALNFGFESLCRLIDAGDSRVAGRPPDDIVVGIVDADGRLDQHALTKVAPFFDDAKVGTVQIGVRIQNATVGLLTRLQDMEFVGFSCLVQIARDRFGSSGLGGNGQFNRLSALLSLGRRPWRPAALTEDLDLGLSLVEAGWRTRFCYETFVAQQGLAHFHPLLRQRTRWIQGHYQCWRHIPVLIRRKGIRFATRVDLLFYLVLVTTVTLVTYNLVVSLAGSVGALAVTNHFLAFVGPGPFHRGLTVFFALAPVVAFMATYQRFAVTPLRWWEVPAYALAFTAYSYMWIVATAWAWTRIGLRRWSWVKTPRTVAAVEA